VDAALAGADRVSESPVILVTGSSSGFGALIVRTLARKGHHVFASMRAMSSRNAGAAAELSAWAQSEGVRLDVVEMDVTSETSVQTCVDDVLARAGRIDVVVNNAGASASGPIEAFSEVQVEALYSLNVFGPWRVNKAVLPSMRQQRSGLLLHISSTLGRVLHDNNLILASELNHALVKLARGHPSRSLHQRRSPQGVLSNIQEPLVRGRGHAPVQAHSPTRPSGRDIFPPLKQRFPGRKHKVVVTLPWRQNHPIRGGLAPVHPQRPFQFEVEWGIKICFHHIPGL
jgi:NAD(P)-dependent dehydrogenase (short-subunit alcohol dehydrogenase family)